MKYVEPGNAMSGEGEKLQVTTVRDYDLKEIDSAIKSIYTGMAMMGFMHLYLKYTNPLFMQSISPVKSALEHNEVKIHLFGKPNRLFEETIQGSIFVWWYGSNWSKDRQEIYRRS